MACNDSTRQTNTPEDSAQKSASLLTTEPRLINPTYNLSIPAELKPYEQVAVYGKVTGFVKRLHVDRGDRVRKGQLLAELDAPEMEQQYLSDKSTEEKVYSEYLYAKQAYDRLSEAAKTQGAVAELELEGAKSRMESARSAYESSQAGTAHSSQLRDYLKLTAPFDGVITERNVSSGALVGTDAALPLFRIAQGNRLRLTVSLPQKHAASVQPGMKAQFTVSSQPGQRFDAILSRTSGLLDDSQRSLTLEFDVENDNGSLQGGDYAQADLYLKRQSPSVWIPAESLLKTQSGTYVLTVADSSISRVPVEEGIRLDSLIEVFGPLDPQVQILRKPSEEINEGPLST